MNSRQHVIFAGTDLSSYGVYISGSGVYNAPERSYEEIIVPGRNGTLYGDEKRMGNVEVTYPAFIHTDFDNNARALRSFLLSKVGYQRLQDTYHPDEFRQAIYHGGTEFEMTQKLDAGKFDLVFDCKPQRFLLSGEETVTFTSAGTLTNPTAFNAKPMIRAYGVGSFTIGSTTVTVASLLLGGSFTDFDCDIMEAFCGNSPRNHAVSITGTNDFPVLVPGENAISMDGITSIESRPRWFNV